MKIQDLFGKTHTGTYITTEDKVDYSFEEDQETLYIFFQGSNQKVDGLNNFTFVRKPYKDMDIKYRVHGGFLKCGKSIEDIVIKKITEKNENGYKFHRIIVSGYSHGGALAAFCHECIGYHRPDIRENCWSFGFEGPRIYAGFKVKKELRERGAHFMLIRNDKDIVTHLPPHLFSFCDVGTVLHIGRDARFGPIKSHYPDNVFKSLCEINIEIDD